MLVLNTIADCNAWRKNQNTTVGFVPTMGALHEGHLSLIKHSQEHCTKTLVSIYINPAQFAENEDLSSYPKTINEDFENLKKMNVDAVFIPTDNEMCPDNQTKVFSYENALFKKLEGQSRPHFFYGVTKVVAKLFDIVQPTHTFFGEKDAQQLIIIKEMIGAMRYPVVLISCPTIRDNNGLALSSRNNYLTKNETKQAAIIYQSLMQMKEGLNQGISNTNNLKEIFKQNIITNHYMKIDYISIADIKTLDEVSKIEGQKILVSTAVFFKDVRLIDNFIY